MMKTLLLKSTLIFLPITFLLIGLNFNRTWYGGDPEYAYLMNGINIATLHSVGHTDNPGTPVQMYSALVLRIAHVLNFSEKRDLQTAVLSDPDHYVEIERKVMIALNSLMLLLLGMISLLLVRNIWLSLLLQATPFISSNLLEAAFTKVSPEPMLILLVMIFILVILSFYATTEEKKRHAWIFGIITGAGLAIKATFLPLALLPLLLLTRKQNKLIYLLSVIPAFVLFTIPAIPEYPHMAKWFLGLSTHTGTYGTGSSGIVDFSAYFASLPLIIRNNLAMSFSVLSSITLGIIFIIRLGFKGVIRNKPARFALSIAIVQMLGILMVAKHYHANHYLIPCISLSGLVWIFIIYSLRDKPSFIPDQLGKYLAPAILIIFFGFSVSNRNYLVAANNGYKISNEELTQVETRLNTEFSDYVKAYYYPMYVNRYSALRWGSVYSRQLHLDALMTLYPKGLFYDLRINRFQLWEATISAEDLVNEYGSNILLVGGPLSEIELENISKSGLKLLPLYTGRVQAFYKVDTSASALFSDIGIKPLWSVFCGAEKLSDDKAWFEAGGMKFQNNNNQTNETVRSGSQALKLDGKDTYALSIELDSVSSGQRYKFSGWRKGGSRTAFLVAASSEPGIFYEQKCEYLKTDEKGWNKIILDITLPDNFKTGKLKFYLWNSSNSVTYFDDLSLSRVK
jgi:hypothetical protein